ncbi:MAG: hypothetical protein ACRDK9_05095 [Solirubrobacterales bacterium]
MKHRWLTIAAVGIIGSIATGSALAQEAPSVSDVGVPAPAPGAAPNLPAPPPPDGEDGVVALDDSTCPSGNVCFWTLQDFQGTKRVYGNNACCSWLYVWFGQYHNSLKNRFTNRKVLIGDPFFVLDCINAGGNRKSPPSFDRFRVGQAGSSC